MKVLVGNLFESKATTLVNTVNCVGVMGKGIALTFKQNYPYMCNEYVSMCKSHKVKPGEPYLYQDLTGVSILNFPTKDHWKSPSKLSYIINGLKWFKDNYENLGLTSVAFPPLGCGNGGLSWDIVGPIMYEYLSALPIEIEIYAPYGTSQEKLTKDYLSKNTIHSSKDVLGSKNVKFNPHWLLILDVVKKLSENRYALSVGRTIFQKICYVLTSQGIETGFAFQKGSFGPYAPQVKEAITTLSNANLMIEKQLGQMISVQVTTNYNLEEKDFTHEELHAVEKTFDLFSRIRSTDQAEMIATVLYSYDLLKKKDNLVKDIDVYNFVIDWKPKWESEKSESIKETIQHLAMLDWMDVKATMKAIAE